MLGAMNELPQPDLMDRSGRLRRLVLASIIGAAAFAIAWTITNQLAKPDELAQHGVYSGTSVRNAYRFIWYFSGATFAGAFAITLAITNALAKRKWRRELVPPAKQLG